MNDDFNTPDAITVWFDLISAANQYLTREIVTEDSVNLLLQQFKEMDRVLGIIPRKEAQLDEQVDQLIRERTEARQAKNWARADEIRDQLTEMGILLEDTPQGIRWRRK